MSVGVRGFRVGTGPRGPYMAGGRGGLYFRQSLRNGAGATQRAQGNQSAQPMMVGGYAAPIEALPMTTLDAYAPASSDMLANYIASQRSHRSWFTITLITAIILNLMILGNAWPAAILTLPLGVAGAIYIYMLDRQRTHVVLDYQLDPAEHDRYNGLCEAVRAFGFIDRVVQVETRQAHGDWKHNAGASTAIQTQPVRLLQPRSIKWLETNAPVWGMQWRRGDVSLLFLPDRVLVSQGRKAAGLLYRELQITMSIGRYVEQESVPRDAQVVGTTWQYPNKDGGPDRRYAYNRQWPVISAAYVSFHSAAGLNLTLQASNIATAQLFVTAVQNYQPLTISNSPSTSQPTGHQDQ